MKIKKGKWRQREIAGGPFAPGQFCALCCIRPTMEVVDAGRLAPGSPGPFIIIVGVNLGHLSLVLLIIIFINCHLSKFQAIFLFWSILPDMLKSYKNERKIEKTPFWERLFPNGRLWVIAFITNKQWFIDYEFLRKYSNPIVIRKSPAGWKMSKVIKFKEKTCHKKKDGASSVSPRRLIYANFHFEPY